MEASLRRPANLSPLHVLVVHDDPTVREALTGALDAVCVVSGAAAGVNALAVLDAQPVSAMILDVVLGHEDGVPLMPRLRQCSPAPILFLTGYGPEELALRAFRTGVQDYLKTPLDCSVASRARVVRPGIARPLAPRPSPGKEPPWRSQSLPG